MLPRKAGAGSIPRAKASAPAAPPAAGWQRFAPLIAAALACAAYANTLTHDFVWDDRHTVVLNEHIRSLGNLPDLVSEHVFAGAGEAMEGVAVTHYYRPVWMVTLALDHALWGLRPLGYHLTNILLHAANSALVTWLLIAWLGAPAAALGAGALFALHPVHTEAVAWVSARNELLLAGFLLAALLAWRRRSRGPGWIALAIVSFALALLSKETAVVFPLLVWLDEWRAGDGSRSRHVRGPALFGALAAAFLVLRTVFMTLPAEPVPLATRLLTAPIILLDYLRLLFVPLGLEVFHAIRPRTSLTDPMVWAPALLLTGLVLAAFRFARRDRTLVFGLGWILVTLLPVCGILAWLKPTPVAERYLYLPSVGWAVAIGVVLAHLEAGAAHAPRPEDAGRRRRILEGATLGLAVLFFAGTWIQNGAWRDKLTILERIAHDAGDAWPAGHETLGLTYRDLGRWEDAARELAAAARLKPDDPTYHLQLGHARVELGALDEAEPSLRRAAELAPQDAEARYELGVLNEKRGRIGEAAQEYRAAIALDPTDVESHGALGLLAMRAQRWAEAESSFRAALRLLPDDPRSWLNLGALYISQGRLDEAIDALEHTIRLEPHYANPHFNLGIAYLERKRYADAERSVRAGIGISPSPRALLLLGRVLVAAGKRDQAMAELEPLARASPDSATRNAIVRVLAGGAH